MLRRSKSFCFILFLLITTNAFADDIENKIENAKEFYSNGKISSAIKELNNINSTLIDLLTKNIVETMPSLGSGWQSNDAEITNLMMLDGGITIAKEYIHESQKNEIDGFYPNISLTLIMDNPAVLDLINIMNSPIFIMSQPNAKKVEVNGDDAILVWNEEDKTGEITITYDNRFMLQAKGNHLENDDYLIEIIKKWEFKKVKENLGL